jgi:integrase/recombinase XerD
MERRKAIVVEKGSKTRTVPFTKVTAALLQRWLDRRQDIETLFYNINTWEPLLPNGLLQLFKRLGRRAQVKGYSNPHSFRHVFGKEYVKAGGYLITLAHIMGHESIDTTANFYAIFTNDEIAEAHEKYSPVKQLFNQEDQSGNDSK